MSMSSVVTRGIPRAGNTVLLFCLAGGMMAARPRQLVTVPAGSTLMVRLVSEVSTKQPAGSRFEVVLQEDLRVGSTIAVPAGTPLYGTITRSEGGKRFGKQHLAATITQLRSAGRLIPIVTDTAGVEAKPGGGLVKLGTGTLAGAIIGGGTGAAVGGVVGAAATALGKERHITVPAGTIAEVHVRTAFSLPR